MNFERGGDVGEETTIFSLHATGHFSFRSHGIYHPCLGSLIFQEIANRVGVSAFYVSFVLAPLASNASEVVASMFYAAKKTRKTMTVSLSALEGAACMNNTFW
jgi:hypothetical protein